MPLFMPFARFCARRHFARTPYVAVRRRAAGRRFCRHQSASATSFSAEKSTRWPSPPARPPCFPPLCHRLYAHATPALSRLALTAPRHASVHATGAAPAICAELPYAAPAQFYAARPPYALIDAAARVRTPLHTPSSMRTPAQDAFTPPRSAARRAAADAIDEDAPQKHGAHGAARRYSSKPCRSGDARCARRERNAGTMPDSAARHTRRTLSFLPPPLMRGQRSAIAQRVVAMRRCQRLRDMPLTRRYS